MKYELRPCLIGDKKAFFHEWVEVSQIRDAILRGQASGVVRDTFGIIELEDGTVKRVHPEQIKFLNRELFDATDFREKETPKEDN